MNTRYCSLHAPPTSSCEELHTSTMCEPTGVKREPAEDHSASVEELLRNPDDQVKDELELGPTVLQPADMHYLLMEPKTEPVEEETNRYELLPRLVLERLTSVTCDLCDDIFLTQAALRRHSQAKHRVNSVRSDEAPRVVLDRLVTVACDICNGIFLTQTALWRHAQTTHYKRFREVQNNKPHSDHHVYGQRIKKRGKRPYKCDVCDMTFTQNGCLNIHRKNQHTDRRSYQCDYCQRVMAHRATLISHISVHTKRLGYCVICKVDFPSVGKLNQHFRRSHADLRVYKCKHCERKYKDKLKYDEHMRKHRKEPLKCNICNETLQSGYVREHMKSHSVQPLYQCDFCKKTYANKWILEKHIFLHTEKQGYCAICKKDFESKRSLYFHRKKHLTENLEFVCSICAKTFQQKDLLRKHVKHHSKERPFKCSVCSVTFKQKGILNRHMNIHTKQYYYQCDYCKNKFSRKNSLKNHMLVHTNYRAFKCKICEKSFKQKVHLFDHVLLHSGDRPHQCKTCYKTFKEPSKLKLHMRHHTGDESHLLTFGCDICGKSFIHKWGLISHMNCHGDKSYLCDICNKTFTRKQSLHSHLRIHMGQGDHECRICNKTFRRKHHLKVHLLRIHQ